MSRTRSGAGAAGKFEIEARRRAEIAADGSMRNRFMGSFLPEVREVSSGICAAFWKRRGNGVIKEAPNTKLQRSTKFQTARGSIGLEVSLELGVWSDFGG